MPDEERLLALTAEVLDMDEVLLTPELTLDDLDVDSLDLLELVTAIEAEFDVDIDDQRLSACANLGEMNAMIMELIRA